MHETTWNYLDNLKPASEIPIDWNATGYTSEAFIREVEHEAFAGWSGDLEDEEEVAVMARLLAVRPGAKLLDVACGYGRHALIFARKHAMKVTGVDIATALVDAANRRARQTGVSASFIAGHGRDLPWRNAFDHAIVAYNSFSIFGPEDAPRVLRGIRSALTERGRLFLDLDNKPHLLRYGGCHRNWYACHGSLTLQDVHFHYDISVEVTRDVTIHSDSRGPDEFICFKRIYERGEIEALLEHEGFRIEALYGNWDLAPHGESSPKMIILAVKTRE